MKVKHFEKLESDKYVFDWNYFTDSAGHARVVRCVWATRNAGYGYDSNCVDKTQKSENRAFVIMHENDEGFNMLHSRNFNKRRI